MKILLLILLLGISACSSKFYYQTGQNYQQQRCYESAKTPEQREYCSDITDKKYEDYQTQRQEVIND